MRDPVKENRQESTLRPAVVQVSCGMARHPVLQGIIDSDVVARALFRGLLASLLLLADGYVLILASRRVGVYLLLALTASTGLAAIAVVMISYRAQLRSMRSSVATGVYPAKEFRRLIPLLAAAVLLVVPGFVTDALGVLLLTRPVGWLLGATLERLRRSHFHELYEYLRLQN